MAMFAIRRNIFEEDSSGINKIWRDLVSHLTAWLLTYSGEDFGLGNFKFKFRGGRNVGYPYKTGAVEGKS